MADRRRPYRALTYWLPRERALVARVLQGGLIAAVTLMLAGVAVKFATGDLSAPSVTITTILAAPSAGDRLMAAGIAVLVATPALNVLLLGTMWWRQRDLRFMATAAFVAGMLAVAAVVGG